MAFTSTDLTTIQTAIIALLSGAEQVQINGRMYRRSSLAELRNTYDWLESKLNLSGSSGVKRATFNAVSDQVDHE